MCIIKAVILFHLVSIHGMPEKQKQIWNPKVGTSSREGSPTDAASASVPATVPEPTEEYLNRQTRDQSGAPLGVTVPKTSERENELFREYKPFGPSLKLTEQMDMEKRLPTAQDTPIRASRRSYNPPPGFGTVQSTPPGFGTVQSTPPGFGTVQSTPPGFGTVQSTPPGFGTVQSTPPGFGTVQSIPPGFGTVQSTPPGFGSGQGVPPGFGSKTSSSSMQQRVRKPQQSLDYYAQNMNEREESRKQIQEDPKFVSFEPTEPSKQRQKWAGDDSPATSSDIYNPFQRNLPTSSAASLSGSPSQSTNIQQYAQSSIYKDDPKYFPASTQQAATSTTDTRFTQSQQLVDDKSLYFIPKSGTGAYQPLYATAPSRQLQKKKVDDNISTHAEAKPIDIENLVQKMFDPSALSFKTQPNQPNVDTDISGSSTNINQPLQRGYPTSFQGRENPYGIVTTGSKSTPIPTIGGKDSFYSLFPTQEETVSRAPMIASEQRWSPWNSESYMNFPRDTTTYSTPEQLLQGYSGTDVTSSKANLSGVKDTGFSSSFGSTHPDRPLTYVSSQPIEPIIESEKLVLPGRSIWSTVTEESPKSSSPMQYHQPLTEREVYDYMLRRLQQPTKKQLESTPPYERTFGFEIGKVIPSDTKFDSRHIDKSTTHPYEQQFESVTSMHEDKDSEYLSKEFSSFESTLRGYTGQQNETLQPAVSTGNTPEDQFYSLFPKSERTSQSTFTAQQSHQSKETGDVNLAEAKPTQETVGQYSLFGSPPKRDFAPREDVNILRKEVHKATFVGSDLSSFAPTQSDDRQPSRKFQSTTSKQTSRTPEYSLFPPQERVSSTVSKEIYKSVAIPQQNLGQQKRENTPSTRQPASAQGPVRTKIDTSVPQSDITTPETIQFGKLQFEAPQLTEILTSWKEKSSPQYRSFPFPSPESPSSMPSSGRYKELEAEKILRKISTDEKSAKTGTSPQTSSFPRRIEIVPRSFEIGDSRKFSPESQTTIASRTVDEVSWPPLKPSDTSRRGSKMIAKTSKQETLIESPLTSPPVSSPPSTFKEVLSQPPPSKRAIDEKAWPALTSSKSSGPKGISTSPPLPDSAKSSPSHDLASSPYLYSEDWSTSATEQSIPAMLTFSEIVRRNNEQNMQPATSASRAIESKGKQKSTHRRRARGGVKQYFSKMVSDAVPRANCVLLLPDKEGADRDVIEEITRLNLEFVLNRRAVQFPTGAVLILCSSPEEAANIKQIVTSSGSSLKVAKGMKIYPRQVRIDDIPRGISRSDILSSIKSTFEAEAPRNLRLEHRGNNKMLATMEVNSHLLKQMESSPRVEIGGRKFKIDTSVDVYRCKRCHRLGHQGQNCGSPLRDPPTKDEPCLDCTYFNDNYSGVGNVYKRNLNHVTGDAKCPTKLYYERKWKRTQKPYDQMDEQDYFGSFSDSD